MTKAPEHPPALFARETGIARAAVIGAGSMGAGIAAQFANAGVPVDLLDIPGDDADRDAPARRGIDRQLTAQGFMSRAAADLVTPGNTEDHLDRLGACDWIVEAVVENAEVKRNLYRRIDAVRKPGAAVSSNTSTLRLGTLVEDQSAAFARDFVITHFFNPPRVMQLLEIVTGDTTDPDLAARLREAGHDVLGKTVVDCRDTPGFIANRVGMFLDGLRRD